MTRTDRSGARTVGVVVTLAAVALVMACAAAALPGTGATARAPRALHQRATFQLPAIKHVFVIVLENETYGATFGKPTADPYLAKTLVSHGALLKNYYGIGHNSNDNYIALVSGQPPNADTQADCQKFVNFPTGGLVANGLEPGKGCVYPRDVPTIGNELTTKGRTWKGYEQDMGNVPAREAAVCGHPKIGSADHTEVAVKYDGYASRHDPFVYFHSVINSSGYCDAHVVPLGSPTGAMPPSAPKTTTGLVRDLRHASTTPNLSFITPNLCNDGHDYPCVNQKSGASRLADIDTFLGTWVPKILASPAYKADGMLIVTFDESESFLFDSTACCSEKPGPTGVKPGINGPGGGRIGAVLISRYIRPGTVVGKYSYNHYSLLATLEKIFRVPLLGDARTVPTTFGHEVFNQLAG
jgi:hypothetical protein